MSARPSLVPYAWLTCSSLVAAGLAVDKYGGHRVIVFSTSCTFFGFFMLYLATPPAHGLEPVFRLPPGAFGFFYGSAQSMPTLYSH